MKTYNIGIVGATGMVGQEMLKLLAKRGFPLHHLRLFASPRSQGRCINFMEQVIKVENANESSYKGLDLVLFSAGGAVSQELAPRAAEEGAVVIDNSSAFRLKEEIPLIAVGVNEEILKPSHRIIANPNCSTIQMVVALEPLYREVGIARIIVDTYQAVSGTGYGAVEELKEQSRSILEGREAEKRVYPHQIAFNVLPHIDVFYENGYTKEEMKMVLETKKILDDDTIRICGTAVRVPVFNGHCEAITIETREKVTREEAVSILRSSSHLKIIDDPKASLYPLPIHTEEEEAVLVGRIREDLSHEKGLLLWVVANNLWKGAALNTIQIGESLIERGLL